MLHVEHVKVDSSMAGAQSGPQLRSHCKRAVSGMVHAKSGTLDQYEGKSDSEFSEDYLNPDKGTTDDKDMEYEHPADLERPQFHPMGQRGFVSDPCGPLYDPKHERCIQTCSIPPEIIFPSFGGQ